MTDVLKIRTKQDETLLAQIESEAIEYFKKLKESHVDGPWDPSPVEDKFLKIREALVQTPGVLREFRHWFLVAGRHNFPDSPGKTNYLNWGSGVPLQTRIRGGLFLWKMARTLNRYKKFKWKELGGNLIGKPTTYRVPKTIGTAVGVILNRVLGRKKLPDDHFYHVTEAQLRYFYYRQQFKKKLGSELGNVLEIGGGYGGLGVELLQHFGVNQYVLIDLPDTLPLAYFYFRACFDVPVQALSSSQDKIDPQAKVVLAPAWVMPQMKTTMDLLINTMSFQHMNPESVKFYLGQADQLETKTLYLVNRDTKRDPTDLVISEYPISSEYKLVNKDRWLFGPHPELIFSRQAKSNLIDKTKIKKEMYAGSLN